MSDDLQTRAARLGARALVAGVGAGANVLASGRFGNAGPVGACDAPLLSAARSCAA